MSASRPLLKTGKMNHSGRKRGKLSKNSQNKITSYFSPDKEENKISKLNGCQHLTNGFHDEDYLPNEKTKKVLNGCAYSLRTRSQTKSEHLNGISDHEPVRNENAKMVDQRDGHIFGSPSQNDSSTDKVSSPPGSGPTTPHKIQAPRESRLRLDAPISPSAFNKLKLVSPKKLNFSTENKVTKTNSISPSQNTSKPAAEYAAKPSNALNKNNNNNSKPAMKNTQMTQYFPIRRSHRKSKTKLLLEKQKQIEEKILSGKQEGLKIECFEAKGRGIVTTRPFKKGEMVVEYVGNLMEVKEAKDKEMKYALDSSKGCYMYYFTFHNVQYCIDATEESPHFGRLVNHSRNGNLVPKAVEVKGCPHLILMAKVDIPEGKEILYDYGDRSKQALEHHPWLAY